MPAPCTRPPAVRSQRRQNDAAAGKGGADNVTDAEFEVKK
jgi:hypothetical protein